MHQVLDAYGDTLDAERKHEDAAVSYLAAGQLAKALNAYRYDTADHSQVTSITLTATFSCLLPRSIVLEKHLE